MTAGSPIVVGRDWPEVDAWRRAVRAALQARRLALPGVERAQARNAVIRGIRALLPGPSSTSIGFNWPFKGEIDLRPFLALAANLALPVTVGKGEPLEFWAWRRDMALRRGVRGIPIPAEPSVVRPSVPLIPLLGFDAAGYRLG